MEHINKVEELARKVAPVYYYFLEYRKIPVLTLIMLV
jgi:hypothetical protein